MKRNVRTIMKVTTIILGVMTCFSTLLLASSTDAQNLKDIRINLTAQNETLASILAKLENTTHIAFAYDKNVLKGIIAPRLEAKNQPLNKFMQDLLKGSSYEYEVLNNNIVIGKARNKPVKLAPGKLYGKILDDKGEGLPGASIKIIELNRTVSSAVDGSYSLSAEPGDYTIEVSYISYQSKRIADVQIKSAGLTQLDVVLKGAANALKGVVIQSSFKKEAVAGLYAQQKNAAGITDGISAEQIARTPDNNLGQVLKRISGVSTVDNRYVVVRGLTERYNQGMIDGVILPSTDMNFRNFSFDVLPVEMVSNVVVNKTATPDMSAEFAGGQISVNTLDIPLENFTSVAIGTGFNSNTLGKEFVQAGKRGKYDFLGFDDGHRKLPAGIQSWGGAPVPDYAGQQSRLLSADAFKLHRYTGTPNQNYRLSAGRVYSLKGDQKWGFIAGLNLRNSQEISEYTNVRGFEVYQGYPKHPKGYIDSLEVRRNGHFYKFNTAASAMVNMGIQGKNYKIGLKNVFSQIFNNTFSSETGNVPSDLFVPRTQKNFQNPEITRILQHKLEGEHSLTDKGLKLIWLLASTSVRQETRDQTRFTYRFTGFDHGTEYFQSPAITTPADNAPDYDYRLFTNARERDLNWAVNLSQEFQFLGDKSLIKVGYNGTYKKRSLDATKLKVLTTDRNFDNFSRPYEDIMEPDKVGTGLNQAFYFADGNNGQQFDGKSKFHAGYLMLDQRFFHKFRAIYGLRVEKYDLNNKQLEDKTSLKPTGEKNTVYLPSINLTYSLSPSVNIRAAFAKTIIRPDFRETSYFGAYDQPLDAFVRGANLQSTKINNTDLRFEWYPSPGEIISVSGFYKTFDKPIELVVGQDGFQTKEYRFQNQKDAVNYGAEIEIRKSLGFIYDRQWLRNFTIFANGTLIRSKIHTLSYAETPPDTTENKETRALYGQSPFIINAGLSYNSAKYGATLNYNRSGSRTFTVAADPNFTEFERGRDQVDLQLFCRLMKQKLEIKMNIGNLLNTEALYYVNGNGYIGNGEPASSKKFVFLPYIGTDKYEKDFDDVRYKIKHGLTCSFTVSYKF